jgi:integrase
MSSPKVLTVARIEAAKPKEARYELPDAGLPGFYLIVQTSGAKSFALRYRAAGKPRKLTIGGYPKFTLEAARKLAREAVVAVARGEDPGAEKKAARQPSGVPQTVDALVPKFMEDYARNGARKKRKQPPKPRTLEETGRLLRDVLAAWKGRRLDSIRRRDVAALLNGMAGEHAVKANRALAALRCMFGFAVKNDYLETSPCSGVDAPSPEISRDRVLKDAELRLVMRAMEKLEAPLGPFARMLGLTLQRRNEVAGMRWGELDLVEGVWTIPGARTKNSKLHIVPLAPAALAILEAMKAERFADSDFVFTSTGRSPVSGFAKLKSQLDRLITTENGGEPIAPWRFHDLRRTGASKMPRLGVALPIVEKVLNHTSGSFAGVVGVYQRHDFQDEKRAALEAWAAFLGRLTEGGGDNVASLGEHRAARQAALK